MQGTAKGKEKKRRDKQRGDKAKRRKVGQGTQPSFQFEYDDQLMKDAKQASKNDEESYRIQHEQDHTYTKDGKHWYRCDLRTCDCEFSSLNELDTHCKEYNHDEAVRRLDSSEQSVRRLLRLGNKALLQEVCALA